MAQFRVTFDCDNDVFHPRSALPRAIKASLKDVAKSIDARGVDAGGKIYDENGNSIGRWDYSERDDLNS